MRKGTERGARPMWRCARSTDDDRHVLDHGKAGRETCPKRRQATRHGPHPRSALAPHVAGRRSVVAAARRRSRTHGVALHLGARRVLSVHHRALPRGRRRHRARRHLARHHRAGRRPRRSDVRRHRPGRHRRLPPAVHPRLVQGTRPLKIALAFAGSLAIEGGILRWVADHRKHHRYSDGPGDPHSPWRFGTSPRAVLRGFWWAHTGWLFDRNQVVKERYAPDLAADPDLARIHRLFPLWVAISLLLPPAIAFAATGGSLDGGRHRVPVGVLVRVFLLHHVTYSINSICHMVGRPAVPHPRPQRQRLAARGAQLRRVVAQPAPRRPDLRAARRAAGAARQLGARHPLVRAAGLGLGRALAAAAPAGSSAVHRGRARRGPARRLLTARGAIPRPAAPARPAAGGSQPTDRPSGRCAPARTAPPCCAER